MLLSALTGMSLSACSDSDDATQTPDGETTGEGGETGDNENENDKAVVIDYTVAEAAYWGDDYMADGSSNLIIYLYDSPRNAEGVHIGPKDHFNIDMNLPNFLGGELLIPAGTYPIGKPEVYAPNTLEPGFADEIEIGGIVYGDYYGVFHQRIDAEQNETYEMIDKGEMTVAYENGIYTLTANFTTEEGVVYRISYKGAITVDDESLGEPDEGGSLGTLTGDVEVGTLARGQLYYLGADDQSSLFGILLGSEGLTLSNGTGTGEMLQFFLNADPNAIKELPDGEYEIVSRHAAMQPLTAIEGYKEEGQLGGSWYFMLNNNLTIKRAPAYEGTIAVKHTAGTLDYTIDFEFYDDDEQEEHVVSGTFSGKMEYIYDADVASAERLQKSVGRHRQTAKRTARR